MIKVSGCSDDLIEIEGDWEDEIGSYDMDTEITFDDGTVLLMRYGQDDEGSWRVKVLKKGSAAYTIEKLIDNGDYYSDLFSTEAESIIGIKQKHVG